MSYDSGGEYPDDYGDIVISGPIPVKARCPKCKVSIEGFVDDKKDVETKRLSLLLEHRCSEESGSVSINISDSVVMGDVVGGNR